MEFTELKSVRDGLLLQLAVSEPKETPRAVVQISHGMMEHKERYFPFMEFLNRHGFACVIHDHRGHGASVKDTKDLGYFYTEDWMDTVEDLYQVTCYAKKRFLDLPVWILGHSMGSLILRCYLKEHDDAVQKVILCGPPTYRAAAGFATALAKRLSDRHGGRYCSRFLYRASNGMYNRGYDTPGGWLNSDPHEVLKYLEDPLCNYHFSVNGYYHLFALMQRAYVKKGWQMKNRDLPILILAGSEDPVVQSQKKARHLVRFLKERGYRDVTLRLYPKLRHELLLERKKDQVYADILAFLEGSAGGA